MLSFSQKNIPEVHFGADRALRVADDVAAIGQAGRPVVLVTDAVLVELGAALPLVAALEQAGAEVAVFSDLAGEPKESHVDAATALVRSREAGLVICLGGGSAMDVGKIAAAIATRGEPAAAYAMEARPLPRHGVPKICIPTTAGTGSELSSTNIFTSQAGRKVWIWDALSKPDRVILDPELTVSLPPALTAWTGIDAFAHALESCTNRYAHPGNDLFAHKALGLIAGALETAVREPANRAARGDMLLGSAYAGIAIDNCSAGLAHNLSHALAALAPVRHGLATGLALEVVLGWQVETDQGRFAAAAVACGLPRDGQALVSWYRELLDRCGVVRRLPAAFAAVSAARLAAEMRAPETRSMRLSSVREVGEADIERFAEAMLALA
jgi:alcohol dehydrogenase class IV